MACFGGCGMVVNSIGTLTAYPPNEGSGLKAVVHPAGLMGPEPRVAAYENCRDSNRVTLPSEGNAHSLS